MKTSDMLIDASEELLKITEDLGAVVTHLREAREACDNGSLPIAESDAEDAASVLRAMEFNCSRISADLEKWIAFENESNRS